jgi:uncharacterized heparinase superfamily protein
MGADESWHEALRQPGAFTTCESDDGTLAQAPVTQEVNETIARQMAMVRYMLGDYVRHERQIELSMDGQWLKGKDIFDIREDADEDVLPTLTARFHLHPDIRCQRHPEGDLTLKSVHGVQWRFHCSLEKGLSVQESVYLGYEGKPQRTQQIIVPITLDPGGSGLHWELKKQA